jgi:hypothetical protein
MRHSGIRTSGTWARRATIAAAVIALPFAAVRAAEVKVEKAGEAVKITVDGKPYAEYLAKHGHQPIVWPIIGPGGQAMTRQFPMGEKLEGEETDHGHHRSLWFTHGIVNGLDFWLEPGKGKPDNQITQRGEAKLSSGATGKIVTQDDWTTDGKKICEDERTLEFGADKNGRWIDVTILVKATEGDVTFGDTKEGAFGMRVPGTMSLKSKKGGKIRNSNGQEDEPAWGQHAEWVDYNGPVDGKQVGIAAFDLPDSFRHPTRWHVRDYGLFAANPFGKKDFKTDDQGDATIKKGDTMRLHYRVLFYEGAKTPEELTAIYKEYGGK